MPILELTDVRVSYGGIKALKGIHIAVRPGEIVAMIGANGAGKTTTLKSVMRLLPLAGGTIRFGGKDTSGMATEDLVSAGVSLAPEGRAIFPNLTVRENLELGAYLHRDEIERRLAGQGVRPISNGTCQYSGHTFEGPCAAALRTC